MKRLLVSLFLIFISFQFYSQNKTQKDKIILKNGTSLIGTITERVIGEYVKVQTDDGKTRVIAVDEIVSIEKTKALPVIDLRPDPPKRSYKKNGFESIIGFSACITPSYIFKDILKEKKYQTYGVGAHWINGYRFARKYFVGLGISYEKYENNVKTMPLFIDAQICFLDYFISPLFSFSGGYAFGWSDKLEGNENGGVMLMPSIGAKFSFSKHAGLIIRFAYKIQQMKIFSHYRYLYMTPVAIPETKWFHMSSLRIEFVF